MSADSTLREAITAGDREAVASALESGADPRAADANGQSALWLAHRTAADANGRAIVAQLRRATQEAIGKRAIHGLATLPADGALDAVSALRRSMASRGVLDVLLLECEVKVAAKELAKLVASPRREADVAARPVADAARLAMLYRLQGSAWTVLPLVFDLDARWSLEAVPELETSGDGLEPLARALAFATQQRTLHLRYDGFTVHSATGGIESHEFTLESSFVPHPSLLPSEEEARARLPEHGGDVQSLREAAARAEEQERRFQEMQDALEALGVVVPPMRIRSDGHHAQLELRGVSAAQVERLDLVVLQELGDPTTDRRAAAPIAPPRAAPVPGQPPLAQGPPPIVATAAPPPAADPSAPPPVEAPPRTSAAPPPPVETPPRTSAAPPPLVAEPPKVHEPAARAEPPQVSEPPPMVQARPAAPPADAPPPAAPPLTEAPPAAPPADSPRADAPPPVTAPPADAPPPPADVAPPPLVREPPPVTDAPPPPLVSEPPPLVEAAAAPPVVEGIAESVVESAATPPTPSAVEEPPPVAEGGPKAPPPPVVKPPDE